MKLTTDNPMTGTDFDWMVWNHACGGELGWKAPVKACVSGVSLLQLSPVFASIFPLSPQKRLILRLSYLKLAKLYIVLREILTTSSYSHAVM